MNFLKLCWAKQEAQFDIKFVSNWSGNSGVIFKWAKNRRMIFSGVENKDKVSKNKLHLIGVA